MGLEPATYGLQNRCSAIELHRPEPEGFFHHKDSTRPVNRSNRGAGIDTSIFTELYIPSSAEQHHFARYQPTANRDARCRLKAPVGSSLSDQNGSDTPLSLCFAYSSELVPDKAGAVYPAMRFHQANPSDAR
jgi:hypothetical protein